MKVQFTKTFPDYEAAALWLHAHGYSAVVKFEKDGRVTITLEGQHAIKAIEQATNSKVREAA